MLGAPPPWLADCDGPGAKPARNAAQDEFDALHLLWHNTGLGGQRTLFELHHCNNTPAQRNELIGLVKQEMKRVTSIKPPFFPPLFDLDLVAEPPPAQRG
jgi:hypothetical protein